MLAASPLLLSLLTASIASHAGSSVPVALTPVPPILDPTAIADGLRGRPSVDPCTDFYRFACGAWLDRTQIPPDKTGVNRQTTAALDTTDISLHKILEALPKQSAATATSAAPHVQAYFESCLKAESSAPTAKHNLHERLLELRAPLKGAAFARLVAQLQLGGAGPLFGFGSAQDLDDATQVSGDLGQGGIALGQRDFYFPTDAKGREILDQYAKHIRKILRLTGLPDQDANSTADSVMKIEIALAKDSYTLADQNDPAKTHHKLDLAALARLAPHFDWAAYFAALGAPPQATLNVDEPEFFQAMDKVLVGIPPEALHAYLAWHFLHGVAAHAGGAIAREDFRFWHEVLNGAKRPLPRWKFCTQAVEGQLGYALAEIYVKTFDGAAIRAKAEQMTDRILKAFLAELKVLSTGPDAWMDAETASRAADKIATLARKIGAPDKWRDYGTLRTQSASFLENTWAVARFESRRDLNKIGRPVDRTEWLMMPWEINAYYDRSKNEMNLPFGILKPPSLDLAASDGVNYGAFGGGTIGHELSHGFDNNGAQYDAKGNLRNWWTPATLAKFQDKAACFVKQASAYRGSGLPLPVNGQATLEENLADQAGVMLGYQALAREQAERAAPPLPAQPFTERQQYWLAYAQSWCTKMTPENLRQLLTTDVHPPPEFRVNVVVMNRPDFANDFQCRGDKPMAPAQRCSLW